MKIQIFEHVAHEDAGIILDWAAKKKHSVAKTCFYQSSQSLPGIAAFDWLVIMGGPMNIYEHAAYPWLIDEKKLIRSAIDSGKTVIGICLGSQLIADVLGGRVTRNPQKEIGWHPIHFLVARSQSAVFKDFPESMTVLHWHGDTFQIPPGAVHLAKSDGCANQAFLYRDRVLGIQFHLEAKDDTVRQFIAHGRNELVPGRYIQTEQEMLSKMENVPTINKAMLTILDRLYQQHTNHSGG